MLGTRALISCSILIGKGVSCQSAAESEYAGVKLIPQCPPVSAAHLSPIRPVSKRRVELGRDMDLTPFADPGWSLDLWRSVGRLPLTTVCTPMRYPYPQMPWNVPATQVFSWSVQKLIWCCRALSCVPSRANRSATHLFDPMLQPCCTLSPLRPRNFADFGQYPSALCCWPHGH